LAPWDPASCHHPLQGPPSKSLDFFQNGLWGSLLPSIKDLFFSDWPRTARVGENQDDAPQILFQMKGRPQKVVEEAIKNIMKTSLQAF
jgi:hypothetical protein